MNQALEQPRPAPARRALAANAIGSAATAAAGVVVVLLAVRLVAANDIGFHLACGEEFLSSGRIVQTNQFSYAKLDPQLLSRPENLGPGCRFDATTGVYHFVNGNWLGQVIMALAYRLGGMAGLGLWTGALVAGVALALAAAMRRMGVAWHWLAAGLLLVGATAYERFDLRPELFGYLILAVQLWLLLEPWSSGQSRVQPLASLAGNHPASEPPPEAPRAAHPTVWPPTWRRAMGVIVLQALAVNISGYFVFGVLLAAAVLVDAAGRWLWARTVAMADAKPQSARLKWAALVAGGTALACLVNPWFARGAVLPLQTAGYVLQNHILRWPPVGPVHPWALTGEWSGTFSEGFAGLLATKGAIVLVALAVTGAAVAALRRRWAWLLVLAAVAVFSLQARSGLALGAILVVPLVLAALADGWGWVLVRVRHRCPRSSMAANTAAMAPSPAMAPIWGTIVAMLCLAAGALMLRAVVSQRLYLAEGREWRFGLGPSQTMLPLDAAEWININKPAGAVFCDFGDSSNLMFLARRQVPVLTALQTQPPRVVQWVKELTDGQQRFEPAVKEHGIEVVVLRCEQTIPPLVKTLAASPDWVLVQISARHVVFLRRNGANASLARASSLVEEIFDRDVDGFLDRIERSDPLPASALHSCAQLLDYMGWTATAAAAWRRARAFAPDDPEVLFGLGTRLMAMGNRRMQFAQALAEMAPPQPAEAAQAGARALEEWLEAQDALEALVKLRPDHPKAQEVLLMLRRQIALVKPYASRPGEAPR